MQREAMMMTSIGRGSTPLTDYPVCQTTIHAQGFKGVFTLWRYVSLVDHRPPMAEPRTSLKWTRWYLLFWQGSTTSNSTTLMNCNVPHVRTSRNGHGHP